MMRGDVDQVVFTTKTLVDRIHQQIEFEKRELQKYIYIYIENYFFFFYNET